MDIAHAARLRTSAELYIQAPTRENLGLLEVAAEEYKEAWIEAQASQPTNQPNKPKKEAPTSYQRELEVSNVIDQILVKLALQERTSADWPEPWWVLSWRTRYSAGGSNRRFYSTRNGYWTIPAKSALAMLKEMEEQGGFGNQYEDTRRRPNFEVAVSTELAPQERIKRLEGITGPDEDWGSNPLFVIAHDPHGAWKKVMIIREDGTTTFRSITQDPDYMPKKVLRPGADWWLDNSMMDANVQQMGVFYHHLQEYVELVS